MKKKTKRILSIILSIILVVGIITAGVILLKPKDTKRIYPTYKIGSLDEEGQYIESDDSIYSDLFECQGLTIKRSFESDVTYSIYFYYVDESFAEAEKDLATNYSKKVDENYRYARIVINPDKEDKDYKIYFWNIIGIANDLEVSVNTNQPSYSNLAEIKATGFKWSYDSESNEFKAVEASYWNALNAIDVSEMNTLIIVVEGGANNLFKSIKYYCDTEIDERNPSTTVNGTIIEIDVKDYSKIYISVASDLEYKIYRFN